VNSVARSGTFKVRIPDALHRRVVMEAADSAVSSNRAVTLGGALCLGRREAATWLVGFEVVGPPAEGREHVARPHHARGGPAGRRRHGGVLQDTQQMSRMDRDRPPPPTKTTEPRPAWMRDPALLPRKPPPIPMAPDRRRRDDPGA